MQPNLRTACYDTNAFSLVELSIVLVILGLLTGGILAGQSLIRAAELRSVAADVSRYKTAVMTFRDKYGAIPGDFAQATRFWTSAGGDGGDAACLDAQQQNDKATCNGNDDGKIQSRTGYAYYERFMAWKHLANAGLIEGTYLGRTAGAAGSYVQSLGMNVPASKLRNGFFDMFNEAGPGAINFAASNWDRNFISIYGNNSSNSILLPEEAWNLDSKMDDGSPVYGHIISTQKDSPYGLNCTTANDATARYELSMTSPNCILRFALF